MFSSPFSIAITSLREERANLSAFRMFVWFALVWFCLFPLPLGVWEGLRFVILALPKLFSYLFLLQNCWNCVCLFKRNERTNEQGVKITKQITLLIGSFIVWLRVLSGSKSGADFIRTLNNVLETSAGIFSIANSSQTGSGPFLKMPRCKLCTRRLEIIWCNLPWKELEPSSIQVELENVF